MHQAMPDVQVGEAATAELDMSQQLDEPASEQQAISQMLGLTAQKVTSQNVGEVACANKAASQHRDGWLQACSTTPAPSSQMPNENAGDTSAGVVQSQKRARMSTEFSSAKTPHGPRFSLSPRPRRFPDFEAACPRQNRDSLTFRDIWNTILNETCRSAAIRIASMVPRPRGQQLAWMETKLRTFYMSASIDISTFREQRGPMPPPHAAYARQALAEANAELDRQIAEEERQLAVLENEDLTQEWLNGLGLSVPTEDELKKISEAGRSSVRYLQTSSVMDEAESHLQEAVELHKAKVQYALFYLVVTYGDQGMYWYAVAVVVAFAASEPFSAHFLGSLQVEKVKSWALQIRQIHATVNKLREQCTAGEPPSPLRNPVSPHTLFATLTDMLDGAPLS